MALQSSAPNHWMPSIQTKRFVFIEETTEATGLGRTTVCDLIKQGELRTVKIGRRRLVLAESLL